MYKTYLWCHLEYCIQTWNPWTQADELLEKVQRAVRIVIGLIGETYKERLAECGLTTVQGAIFRGEKN